MLGVILKVGSCIIASKHSHRNPMTIFPPDCGSVSNMRYEKTSLQKGKNNKLSKDMI